MGDKGGSKYSIPWKFGLSWKMHLLATLNNYALGCKKTKKWMGQAFVIQFSFHEEEKKKFGERFVSEFLTVIKLRPEKKTCGEGKNF